MSLNKDILVVFGEGGHEEQMCRLMEKLEISSERIIACTDSVKEHNWYNEKIRVSEIRSKHSNSPFKMLNAILKNIRVLRSVFKRNRVKTIISTGPGIAILTVILAKLFSKNVTIIHIETWSRFYSRSITGRVMYKLADFFYIQNRSLSKLYLKAIYSGKL